MEVGSVRRTLLQTTWDFRCTCPRCSGPDDRRATWCRACLGGRVAIQSRSVQLGGATAEMESWCACPSCGAEPDGSQLTDIENQWIQRYEQLPTWCHCSTLRNFLAPKAELTIAAIEEEDGPLEAPEDDATYIAQSLGDVVRLHRALAKVDFLQLHWLAADVAGACAVAGLLLHRDAVMSSACREELGRLQLEVPAPGWEGWARLQLEVPEITAALEQRLQALRRVFGAALSVEVAEVLRWQALAADLQGGGDCGELRRKSFEIAVQLLPPGPSIDKELSDELLYEMLAELAE
eukprot:Skav232924  [mRNA]  locus=scaffold1477:831115:831993:- [translate_table: standard]